jgi:hypothetical protein
MIVPLADGLLQVAAEWQFVVHHAQVIVDVAQFLFATGGTIIERSLATSVPWP